MRKITILKVTNEKQPKGYVKTLVSYKTDDDKVKAMGILPFGEQEGVAKVFADAKPGDVYEVNFQQNAKGFWEFQPTPSKVGEQATMVGETKKSGGNWETTEERRAKQVMIVRQSSLSTAVSLAEVNKAKSSPDDIIKVAQQFEAYVLNGPAGDIE